MLVAIALAVAYPNLPAITLGLNNLCVNVRTNGWPKTAYAAPSSTTTWRFKTIATQNCPSFKIRYASCR